MKDLRATRKILGMETYRDKKVDKLWLTQKNYVKKVFGRFSLFNTKPVQTPLAVHFRLSFKKCPSMEDEVKYMTRVQYPDVVACLMYAMVCTKCDISHAISMVSRYMRNPGKEH